MSESLGANGMDKTAITMYIATCSTEIASVEEECICYVHLISRHCRNTAFV